MGALQQRLVNYQQQVATAGSPLERAHLTDLAHADIAGSVAGHWLAPSRARFSRSSSTRMRRRRRRGASPPRPGDRRADIERSARHSGNFPWAPPGGIRRACLQVGWRAQQARSRRLPPSSTRTRWPSGRCIRPRRTPRPARWRGIQSEDYRSERDHQPGGAPPALAGGNGGRPLGTPATAGRPRRSHGDPDAVRPSSATERPPPMTSSTW